MPIVFVWSSPNEKGLTAAAKNNVLKGVADTGLEFEVIHRFRAFCGPDTIFGSATISILGIATPPPVPHYS